MTEVCADFKVDLMERSVKIVDVFTRDGAQKAPTFRASTTCLAMPTLAAPSDGDRGAMRRYPLCRTATIEQPSTGRGALPCPDE